MSALDTLINSTDGLIVHLPLTDASGSPTKMGPSAASLTVAYGAGAALGQPAIVAGDAYAVRLPNATGAQVTISADPLVLPAGDFTIECFCRFVAFPTGNTNIFGSANQNVQIGSAGGLLGTMIDAASSTWTAGDQVGHVQSVNALFHVALARRGETLRLFVNGAVAATKVSIPTTTRTTSAVQRLGSSSVFDGYFAHWAIYGRALTVGEIRDRCELAGIAPGVLPVPQDRSSDARGRTLAARASSFCDAGSGIKVSDLDARVTDGSKRYLASSYLTLNPAVTHDRLSDTATKQEIVTHQARVMQELLNVWSIKRHAADTNYLDPATTWQTTTNLTWRDIQGAGLAAAILHRYGGEKRHSPNYYLARRTFDYLIASQQVTTPGPTFGRYGDGTTPNSGFSMVHFGMAAMMLWPTLDPDTKRRWLASLIAAAEYELLPLQMSWYVNGNVELGLVHAFWLVYQLSGDPKWLTAAETKLAFTANPPANANGTPSGGIPFGWVETTTATQADGSDGAGYFKEAGVTGSPGLDWNYTMYQSCIASLHYLMSGDTRMLKYANMTWNTISSKITRNASAAWALDARGGTRHNSINDSAEYPIASILTFKGSRAGLLADAAGTARSTGYTLRAQYLDDGGNYRRLGETCGAVVMCADSFPSVRLR